MCRWRVSFRGDHRLICTRCEESIMKVAVRWLKEEMSTFGHRRMLTGLAMMARYKPEAEVQNR